MNEAETRTGHTDPGAEKRRNGASSIRYSPSFLGLTLRLVEMFAAHPPQRTRKDGAPPFVAVRFECWEGIFLHRSSLSRVCLTADKLVLPSGLQAICLRAVILDRWRESAWLAGPANGLARFSFAAERLEIPSQCLIWGSMPTLRKLISPLFLCALCVSANGACHRLTPGSRFVMAPSIQQPKEAFTLVWKSAL